MSSALERLFALAEPVAVITGSSSGIGLSIAHVLSDAGARVVISGRDEDAVTAATEEIISAGGDALGVPCDVTDEDSVIGLFATVVTTWGTPTILVNNAGATPKHALLDMSVDEWDAIQNINLRGTFLCLREGAKAMRTAGADGRIVNISSVSSLHPSVHGNGGYAASKGGVNSLTRAAALDLAVDGITVNAVLPGGVRTIPTGRRPVSTISPAGPITGPGRMLAGRLAEPDEIAAMVLLLVGPNGGYINGQTIVIDGGFLVT